MKTKSIESKKVRIEYKRHKEGCGAIRQVKEGAWKTPWAYPILESKKMGEFVRFKCNSTKCSAYVVYENDDLIKRLNIPMFISKSESNASMGRGVGKADARKIIKLFSQGKPHEQISAIVGWSVYTVKSVLAHKNYYIKVNKRL